MGDNVFSIRMFYAIFGVFISSFTAHTLTIFPTRPPTENSPSVLVPYGRCNKATPCWVALNNLNDCLIVLETRSPEAKCHQGQTASDSGEHTSCLSQLLAVLSVLGAPRLTAVSLQSLPFWSHGTLPALSSAYKDASHMELGPTLVTSS